MWQLDRAGTLVATNFDAPEIPGDAPPETLPDARALVVRFSGPADGRGFSTARRLRAMGYTGMLHAAGPLLPDQARALFDCGFDTVLIEDAALARQGEAAWRDALKHSVGALYVSDGTTTPSVWHARHTPSREEGRA